MLISGCHSPLNLSVFIAIECEGCIDSFLSLVNSIDIQSCISSIVCRMNLNSHTLLPSSKTLSLPSLSFEIQMYVPSVFFVA